VEVDSFGSMNHVAVLCEYLKNSNKNFLKFTKKTQQEIGLNRMQLNKAIKRLVEYGVLEFYRGKNIRIYRIVKQKLR
jgi:DNA-binding MarR family transcriptional regulator